MAKRGESVTRGQRALELLQAKMLGWAHTIRSGARADVSIGAVEGGAFEVHVSWPESKVGPAGQLARRYTEAEALGPLPSCALTRKLIGDVLAARGV